MQVFWAFLKSTRRFLPNTLMYFIIFSAIALFVSFSTADTESSGFQTIALDIGIVDQDKSSASDALKNYMAAMHNLVSVKYDKDELLDRLFYRNFDYILVIPKGFEERLVAGEENGLFETIQIPGIYSSAFIDEQVNTFLKTAKLYLAADYRLSDALANAEQTLSAASNQVLVLETETENKGSSFTVNMFYFYQFLPYALTSMILCGLTPILTIFWEKNLAKRISCASTSLISRNLQLALGSIVYCIGSWILFILVTKIFYGPALWTEKGLLYMINSFLLVPLAISFSLIIGCFAPSFNIINMINNIICLSMSFLCGVFVPQQLLGKNVLAAAKFLPFYWYIKNNNLIADASGEGISMVSFWENWGIQLLFIIAGFSVALMISKYKSKRQKA